MTITHCADGIRKIVVKGTFLTTDGFMILPPSASLGDAAIRAYGSGDLASGTAGLSQMTIFNRQRLT
jgi:hypothetical protein